jgi:Flp pilus assembly protein protease CpaA
MLQVVITVVVPVVAAVAIAYAKLLIQRIKAQMTTEQAQFADMLIGRFVSAAQQYDLSGIVQRSGWEKKAWVVQRVQEELTGRGITIDVGLLADMVEANILKGAKEPITLSLPVPATPSAETK